MLTKSPLQQALLAALIASGASHAALADPAATSATAGSNAYQLKADTGAADIDSRMYRLAKKFQPPGQMGKMPSAMLVPNSSLPDQVQAIIKFTDSNKLADLPFARDIALAAAAAKLDPALVHAVIYVESRYQQHVVSPKGAIGLMQVLPGTAARYGIKDPSRSPQVNLKAGTLYLSDLLRMFDNRTDLALAAYNAGEGAVLRYSNRIPPYRETQMYVKAVLAKYQEWTGARPSSAHRLRSKAVAGEDFTPVRPHVEYLAGTRLDLSQAELGANY